MKHCYILKQGQYGNSWTIGVFKYKKDAIRSAKDGGRYKLNSNSGLYENDDEELSYRFIEKEPYLDKFVPVNIIINM